MHNLMQDIPLRVSRIIDHAATYHPRRRVLGRSAEGPIVTSDWTGIRARALRVAQTLAGAGIGRGNVVAVMAWNTVRMMEVWYGVPGSGAALHTLNPRLSAEQLTYVINHGGARLLLVDADLAPLIARVRADLGHVREFVVMTDAAHMPDSLPDAIPYEDWIKGADGDFAWIMGDERDACGLCYTSGTTGNPKGVVYTHRSNVLHALALQGPDMFNLASADTLMPVVPLFHANGWCTAFSAPLAGSAMVLPGRDLSPPAIHEMLEHGVTFTAAVPSIWLALLPWLDANKKSFSTLRRVAIGGSSCPRAVIERFQNDFGVQVLHAWGMTEMSPVGTVCSFKPEIAALSPAEQLDIQETVGHPPFTVELTLRDDDGHAVATDGLSQGRLMARGDAVVRRYVGAEADTVDEEGWLDTGDVATIDPNGYVRITDRSKDIIKSGGEWISSIDLENAAVAHPDVAEAAAVGLPHPKWGERPVLVVVPLEGRNPDPDAIIALLVPHFAKWQLPDRIIFLDALPHTATGKISKLNLRKHLAAEGITLDG